MIIIIILSKWLKGSIWFLAGTLTGTPAPGQSGLRSKSNDGVLNKMMGKYSRVIEGRTSGKEWSERERKEEKKRKTY